MIKDQFVGSEAGALEIPPETTPRKFAFSKLTPSISAMDRFAPVRSAFPKFAFLRMAVHVRGKVRSGKDKFEVPAQREFLDLREGSERRLAILMMLDPLTVYGKRATVLGSNNALLRTEGGGNLRYQGLQEMTCPSPHQLVFVGEDIYSGFSLFFIQELRRMGGGGPLTRETDVLDVLPDWEAGNSGSFQSKLDKIAAPQVAFPVSFPFLNIT